MSTTRRPTADSSSIACVAYSPQSRTLEIEFRNGARYRYFEVPREAFKEILAAESKGRYFHRSIRRSYAYERISSEMKEVPA